MADLAPPDNRPYPRTERCVVCGVTPVDVVGPGDGWGRVCQWCDAALYADDRRYPTPTLREVLRDEETFWCARHPVRCAFIRRAPLRFRYMLERCRRVTRKRPRR